MSKEDVAYSEIQQTLTILTSKRERYVVDLFNVLAFHPIVYNMDEESIDAKYFEPVTSWVAKNKKYGCVPNDGIEYMITEGLRIVGN